MFVDLISFWPSSAEETGWFLQVSYFAENMLIYKLQWHHHFEAHGTKWGIRYKIRAFDLNFQTEKPDIGLMFTQYNKYMSLIPTITEHMC